MEYAAQQRTKIKGPSCLVASGVGKTLGKSTPVPPGGIARMAWAAFATIRNRCHRRTYIGSMPGKVIQGMKGQDINPLFLLDEVDKMARIGRRSGLALLEVRPGTEQSFNDHYLEVDYTPGRCS